MGGPIVHDKAREDVEAIAAYIAQDNVTAALRFVDAVEITFDFRAGTPGAGPRIDRRSRGLATCGTGQLPRFEAIS